MLCLEFKNKYHSSQSAMVPNGTYEVFCNTIVYLSEEAIMLDSERYRQLKKYSVFTPQRIFRISLVIFFCHVIGLGVFFHYNPQWIPYYHYYQIVKRSLTPKKATPKPIPKPVPAPPPAENERAKLTPPPINSIPSAPMLYSWRDSAGVRHFSNQMPLGDVEDLIITPENNPGTGTAISDAPYPSGANRELRQKTPIRFVGNRILVPVTLGHHGKEVQTLLLLDTGATSTTLHPKVAMELSLRNMAAGRAVVADGRSVLIGNTRIDYLQVGPHRLNNFDVSVIDYKGSYSEDSGLLGMNFLKHVKYDIDLTNRVINWQ
jgi:predicted aspartyl protease